MTEPPRRAQMRGPFRLLLAGAAAAGVAVISFVVLTSACGRDESAMRIEPVFDVSPDGRTIAFQWYGAGGSDIYLYDMQQHLTRCLATSDLAEFAPTFSPDGRTVAFSARSQPAASAQIWTCDLSGAHRRRVTAADADHNDTTPSFGPDGRSLVFSRAESRQRYSMGGYNWYRWSVWLANLDGQLVRPLTHFPQGAPPGPRLLPDGKRFVYERDDSAVLADLAGGNQVLRLPAPVEHRLYQPSPAHDGIRFAFVSDAAKEYRYEVYVGSLDGTAVHQVTHLDWHCMLPRFGPKDEWVYFLNLEDPTSLRCALWRAKVDGSVNEVVLPSAQFPEAVQP